MKLLYAILGLISLCMMYAAAISGTFVHCGMRLLVVYTVLTICDSTDFPLIQQEIAVTRTKVIDYEFANKLSAYYDTILPREVRQVWVHKQQFTSVLDPITNGGSTDPNENSDLRQTLYIVVNVRPLDSESALDVRVRDAMAATSFTDNVASFVTATLRDPASVYRTSPTKYPSFCQDRVRTNTNTDEPDGTNETDVDCGGNICDQCYGGSHCRVSTDCFSLTCLTKDSDRLCAFYGS